MPYQTTFGILPIGAEFWFNHLQYVKVTKDKGHTIDGHKSTLFASDDIVARIW
jgi:hypothetical protein